MEISTVDARLDRAHDDALELPRSARVDQLSAERAQQRLRHRRQPQLPHPLEARRSLADERIPREAPQELGVVGIKGEDESQPLQTLFAFRAQHQASVQRLPRRCDLHALATGLALQSDQQGAGDAFRRAVDLLTVHGRRAEAGETALEWATFLQEGGRADEAEPILRRAYDLGVDAELATRKS